MVCEVFSLKLLTLLFIGTGIQVRCPNSPCKWTGSTGKLQKHEASCKYELSSCPNECKDANNDIKKILKKDLENHMQKE